jgi:hypothetical protein
VAYVRALPDHALLDRIIRGRAWIPLLGVLLVGIVAMQVEVLKLNAGIGRSLERASALQGQNQLLRASVSQLSDEQRIERLAAADGMVMATPAEIKFLDTGPAITERALTSVQQPDATSFAAQLAAVNGAAIAASAQAAATSATPSTAELATSSATSGAADPTPAATSPSSADTAAAAAATTPSPATTPTVGTGATQSASTPPVTPVDTGAATGTGTGTGVPAAGATSQSSTGTSGAAAASGGVSATPTGN